MEELINETTNEVTTLSHEEISTQANEIVQREESIYGRVIPVLAKTGILSSDILSALSNNEDGDAWLFIALQKNRYCYDHSTGQWFKWSSHYWEEDIVGDVITGLDDVVDQYMDETKRQALIRQMANKSGKQEDAKKAEELEKKLLKRIYELQSVYRKKNVLYLAVQGSDSLGITGKEWDLNPWLLACKTGVIDLKTGEVRPGQPEDYIKTVVPTEWKGLDEQAPRWESFLSEIFEEKEDIVAYIHRLFGYSITGVTQDHVIAILWGQHGRNGKGTLLETLSFVLGPIVGPILSDMLLSDGRAKSSAGPSPDVMALRGRRLAWAGETEEGRKLAVEKVKLYTGNDTLVGRPPHGKRMVEFRPTHKLFLLTNHRPQISPTEYALWKRLHLIPFNLSYVDEPEKPFEKKRDPELPEKLQAEASGILASLVRGCLEWQRMGGLCPPDDVKNATVQYQKDEDILGDFTAECVQEKPDGEVRAKDFYITYKHWCQTYGHMPLSGTKFGKQMAERYTKIGDGKGNVYKGIVLIVFYEDVKIEDGGTNFVS